MFQIFLAYARAILGSWCVQSLDDQNTWENIYSHVCTISKPIGFFSRPHTTGSMITPRSVWPIVVHIVRLTAVPLHRCRISRLNTVVRAFVVFEGGCSLPINIITPSVRAESSSSPLNHSTKNNVLSAAFIASSKKSRSAHSDPRSTIHLSGPHSKYHTPIPCIFISTNET